MCLSEGEIEYVSLLAFVIGTGVWSGEVFLCNRLYLHRLHACGTKFSCFPAVSRCGVPPAVGGA